MREGQDRVQAPAGIIPPGVETMVKPEDVAVMLRLQALGWGTKRIACELGVSRNTVRRYVKSKGYQPYGGAGREKALDVAEAFVKERFTRHRGNAEVVRQELVAEKGLSVSLRTVERAVEPLRAELRAQALATVRFETEPGRQLQVDFGTTTLEIAGVRERIHLCVLTLGWSRRIHVSVHRDERRRSWLSGLASGFMHFGGVPQELLIDNARALVDAHDVRAGEVRFNKEFWGFCTHWGVVPHACAPYRARTKGKDERAVGYVKRNAIAGRSFESFEALEAHLQWWMREVADVRVHGTTGERPVERFNRAEAAALGPLAARPFVQVREVVRRVGKDLSVELDTNHYTVPWRLIGQEVTVTVAAGQVLIRSGGEEVARHRESGGRRERVRDRAHLEGVVQSRADVVARLPEVEAQAHPTPSQGALARPLSEYAALVEGGLG